MIETAVLGTRSRIPARSIALPVEHGAWGFLLEPLLAGLLIAPSAASPLIALVFLGGFLMRQPLKFVVGDLRQGKRLPRTAVAIRFVSIFGATAAFGLAGSLFLTNREAFIPMMVAAPMVIYLVVQDAARQTREMIPEVLAAIVLSSSIATLSLAAGHSYLFASTLWITMLARLVPSVLYVRSRLRLEKGKPRSYVSPIGGHIAALIIIAALFGARLGSVLTLFMSAFLLTRAIIGLSPLRRRLPAKQIGIREVVYGVLYALAVVCGYYLAV